MTNNLIMSMCNFFNIHIYNFINKPIYYLLNRPSYNLIRVIVCVFILSYISSGIIQAKDDNNSKIDNRILYKSQIDSVKNKGGLLKLSPSLLSHLQSSEKVEVGLEYKFKDLLPEARPSVAKSVAHTGINASSFRRLGRFSALAKASFFRKTEKEIEAGLTDDSHLFYPYIIADTIPTCARSENYNVESSFALQFNRGWSIGAFMGYTGQIRYTRNDPRVRNTTLSLDYDFSVAKRFSFCPSSVFSFDFGGRYYKQNLSYDIYEPDGAEWVYVMRPFGYHREKYSEYATRSTLYYPDYKESFVRATYFSPEKNIFVTGKFSKGVSKLKTTRAGVFLSERSDYFGELIFTANLFKIKRNTFFIEGVSEYMNSDGKENIYHDVPTYEGSTLVNQELLTSNHIYDNVDLKGRLFLGMAHYFSVNRMQFKLGYKHSYYDAKMVETEDETSNYKNHYLLASSAVELNFLDSFLIYSGELSSFYRIKSNSECVVDKYLVPHGVEIGHMLYMLGPKLGVSLKNNLYIKLNKCENRKVASVKTKYLRVKFNASYARWELPEWSSLVRKKMSGTIIKDYGMKNKMTLGCDLTLAYVF